MCSKILITEPKPKKDTYFWSIWNEDYRSFLDHIATNQHRLSSYADNLAFYYDKIDEINSQLQADMINEVDSLSSPAIEKYDDTPDKSSKEDSSLDNRIQNLNQLVNNILYRDKKTLDKPHPIMTPDQKSTIKKIFTEDRLDSCHIDQNQSTWKFKENINSNTLRWDENLEGSNIFHESQQSLNKPFRRWVNKTGSKELPNVTMMGIEMLSTPQKYIKTSELNYSSWSDYEQSERISTIHKTDQNANEISEPAKIKHMGLNLFKSITSSEQHSFNNIKIRPEIDKTINSILYNKDRSAKNKDEATVSAWKALLRKSKVELVGMLFSTGKQNFKHRHSQ